MAFCRKCGKDLLPGDKFCSECGTPVVQSQPGTKSANQRKEVFEGEIRKCPNCGKPLGAFDLVCPICGHELRNREASTAVQKLASEIADLEAGRDSQNISATGTSENDKPSKNARRKERELTDRKIASLIQNFPIPNTKEDLLEFLILSSSNISEERYSNRITKGQKTISDAWKSKFEQAYQKAKIIFGNTPEFEKIETIYIEKQKNEEQNKKAEERDIRRKKRREALGYFFMISPLFILCFVLLGSTLIADFKETARLEATVDEIYVCIEEENYTLARAKTANLVYSGGVKTTKEKWEKTRREMYVIINQAEGIETEPLPEIGENSNISDDKTSTGDDSDEDKSEGMFSEVIGGLKEAFGF